MRRTSMGAPGEPPVADVYSGTPTQVRMSPSTRSPITLSSSLSAKVIPEAAAPMGLGGLLAIAGGLVFVVIVVRSLRGRP